jgi:hypothetical protein
MKDFRQQVVLRTPDRSEISDLLRQGKLEKALRKAHAAGLVIQQDEIDATAKAMFGKKCAGALLAMIGKVDVKLPFHVNELLIRAFEVEDYHTFLKQAHRLRVTVGMESQIQSAITAIERRSPIEANAWRRKFAVI